MPRAADQSANQDPPGVGGSRRSSAQRASPSSLPGSWAGSLWPRLGARDDHAGRSASGSRPISATSRWSSPAIHLIAPSFLRVCTARTSATGSRSAARFGQGR
jgi:hypothetical protein